MIRYTPVGDETQESHRAGFIRAYQEAFGGDPYFETYSPEEVLEDVWYPHLKDGIIVLALDGEDVVGFGCAVPVLRSPLDVREFLMRHQGQGSFSADLSRAWYMSELGVLASYRRRGIGYSLVRHRLAEIGHRGDTHYVFRTAADGSNSIHLYRKIGAIELADLQDVSVSDQVQVNGSQSTERIYLHGGCESALRELAMLVTD